MGQNLYIFDEFVTLCNFLVYFVRVENPRVPAGMKTLKQSPPGMGAGMVIGMGNSIPEIPRPVDIPSYSCS